MKLMKQNHKVIHLGALLKFWLKMYLLVLGVMFNLIES